MKATRLRIHVLPVVALSFVVAMAFAGGDEISQTAHDVRDLRSTRAPSAVDPRQAARCQTIEAELYPQWDQNPGTAERLLSLDRAFVDRLPNLSPEQREIVWQNVLDVQRLARDYKEKRNVGQ